MGGDETPCRPSAAARLLQEPSIEMNDRHPGILAIPRDIPLRTMLRAVAVVGGAWLLLHLLPVVLVIIVSLFLVGTLGPAVEWLEARGLGRGWGIAVVFLAMALMTGGLLALTIPQLVDQVTSLVKQEPAIRDHLAAALGRWRVSAPLAESLRDVKYEALARTAASTALRYSSAAVEIVAYLVSAVFLAMYMMIDRDRLRGGLFAVVPRTHHMRLSRVMHQSGDHRRRLHPRAGARRRSSWASSSSGC